MVKLSNLVNDTSRISSITYISGKELIRRGFHVFEMQDINDPAATNIKQLIHIKTEEYLNKAIPFKLQIIFLNPLFREVLYHDVKNNLFLGGEIDDDVGFLNLLKE